MDDKKQQIIEIFSSARQAITTNELHERWQNQFDQQASKRTIERIIDQLITDGLIEAENPNAQRNIKWRLVPGASLIASSMTAFDALCIQLLNQYAGAVLPYSAFANQLQQQVHQAELVLKKQPANSPYKRWAKKVFIEQRGQPLLQADIDETIQKQCYQALFEETLLRIQYMSKTPNCNPDKWIVVQLLGLVVRSHTRYLVVKYQGEDKTRLLAMQRIREAQSTEQSFDYPFDFNLHEYVEAGETAVTWTDKPVQLVLKFYAYMRGVMLENPINDTFVFLEDAGDCDLYKVEVKLTNDFESWILSLADKVEVVEPLEYREHIAQKHAAASRLYVNNLKDAV